MGSAREHFFWTSGHRYEDLARQFEQDIALVHPPALTNHCRWCYHCVWCATSVDYYEHRGPRVGGYRNC